MTYKELKGIIMIDNQNKSQVMKRVLTIKGFETVSVGGFP